MFLGLYKSFVNIDFLIILIKQHVLELLPF